MSNKEEFLLSLTNFDYTFRRYDELKKNRFVPTIKDVHKFLRELSVYQYLLFYTNINYTSEELIEMLNQIRQPSVPPATIFNTFRWASNKVGVLITELREQFATSLSKFAKRSEINSQQELFNYFSLITFPSIFCHFADQEFERLGYLFIKILMKTLPSNQYEQLIYSFLLESGEFQSCLWDLFDECASRTVTQDSSAQYFYPLLYALSKASSHLTYYQVKLLLKYKAEDSQAFTSFFVTKFLLNSYNIYHSQNIKLQNQANPIQDLSDYLDSMTRSPHLDMLFSILYSIKKFRKQPPHAMFVGIGDYPIYLSIKDIYILQLIMKLSPDDSMKIPDAFLISEEMTKRPISVQITTLLFVNKDDYKYLYSDKKNESDDNQTKFDYLKNKDYFKNMVYVDEIKVESKNERIEELNERMRLIANQNGFSGSISFLKSDRQGPPTARKQKEKLVKNFDSNTIKYIEGLNLIKSESKLKSLDKLFVTDLYYFDEVQKLVNKITRHLSFVLYFLLGSLYQSDRPSVDPLLTTSIEMHKLQESTVVRAEIQSWAVLRHKDCFNYSDYTGTSELVHSNLFQTLNGKPNRPLVIDKKKKSSANKQYKSDIPAALDLLSASNYGSKNSFTRKRRNSFDATKSVSSSFQLELIKKLGLANKKDKFLMLIIFIRMFDQSNLEDSQVPKLRKLYIQFMDTKRIKKLGKPNSLTFKEERKLSKKNKKEKNKDWKSRLNDFENCFSFIVKMIDNLSKIRKASCILKLAEISYKIQEIASNFVTYFNSLTTENYTSEPSSSSSYYSAAYMLSSFTASARQYNENSNNNNNDNSNNELLHKVAYAIFKRCLLMSTTDAFYVAFIWEQKLMTIFPILKQHANIPHLYIGALEFIEDCFYNYIKKDPDLLEKTHEARRFLFK